MVTRSVLWAGQVKLTNTQRWTKSTKRTEQEGRDKQDQTQDSRQENKKNQAYKAKSFWSQTITTED